MNCTHCLYGISNEDIFCPSCGEKVSSYEIFPSKRDLILFESGEYNFTIANKGMTPLEVSGCSHAQFKLHGASNIACGSKETITLKYENLPVGAAGHFYLHILPSTNSEEKSFEFEVVPKPELSFKIKNTTEKDGIFNIPESDVESLYISVNSSSRIAVNKPPLIKNDTVHRLTSVNLANVQREFEFGITATKEFRKGSTIELDVEFYFNGLTVRKLFKIKVVAVASLKFNPTETQHNATIEGKFSPSRIDLIEGSTHLSEIILKYTVQGDSVRIKDVFIPPLIKLKHTDNEITLPQPIGTQIGSIIGQVYARDDEVSLELEINAGIIPQKITHSLLGMLSDFTVQIITIDTSNGFEAIETATISFNLLERKTISITIDYGTSNSCIAFLPYDAEEQNPQIAELHLHGGLVTQIPSMIKFDDFYDEQGNKKPFLSEDITIGPAAADYINNAEADITTLNSIAWGFKSLLSKPHANLYFTDAKSRTNKYTSLELVSLYINKLIYHFESTYPYKVSDLHITYPAAFSSLEKRSLQKAIYALPQFDEDNVHLEITEPVALAVFYANEVAHTLENDEYKNIAIFDCGGGTTDLTLAKLSCEEDEYGVLNRTLSFQASDGVYSKKGEATIGGNYFTFLLARGYKTKFEADSDCEIPFPEQFKLPIELVDSDKEIKFNASKLMTLSDKRKINGYEENTFPHEYQNADGEAKEIEGQHISIDTEQALLDESLVHALSQINIMAYLVDEQKALSTIVKQSTSELTKDIEKNHSKTLVVFANAMFAKVYTFKEGDFSSLKLIGMKDLPESFEAVMDYLNSLSEKNKIPSIFIEHLLLIGFDDSNEVETKDFAEQQSKADIKYFNTNIDTLILGGNSSKHPYVEELAKKLIKGAEIVNDDLRKVGVAQGACLMNQLSENSRSFSIQKNDLLPYSIGYAFQGNFITLLEQWQEVPDENLKESKPRKVSARIADRTISIYENRNLYQKTPRLIPHDSVMQPLIGKISINEDYVDSFIYFTLSNDDKKRLCYSLYSSDSQNGLFLPINLIPIPLHGET
jgi:molecular chaperone DnaK (HSP70)